MLVKKLDSEKSIKTGSTRSDKSSISDKAAFDSAEHGSQPHLASFSSVLGIWILSGDGALNLAKLVMLPWYKTSGLCIMPLPCREWGFCGCSWGLFSAGCESVSRATSLSSTFPLARITCSVLWDLFNGVLFDFGSIGSEAGVLLGSGTGLNIRPRGTQFRIKAPMIAIAPRQPYSATRCFVIGANRNVPSPDPHTAIPVSA